MASRTRLEILDEEIEWRLCEASVEYFAANYCYIRHPDTNKGAIRIPLRPEQREVLRIWESGGNTISLKARQIGWSTIVCIYSLWLATFKPSSITVLLSKKQDDARDLIKKCKFVYDRLPDWMHGRVDRTNRSVDSIQLSNDSLIEALPSKKDPARGKSASFIVLDELAFFDDPENAWAAIEPTIDIGGQCAALSTANGAGNFFHRFYKAAKAGQNGFTALFYSWRVVPERDDDWYERQQIKLPPWQLAQEYPENDVMAFVVSGSPAFDSQVLMNITPETYRKGWLKEGEGRDGGMVFHESAAGDVHIFREPVPNHNYVIGGDIAEGRATGDYSCAQVIDTTTMEQVARWHGHINVDLFADELYRLGQYYNWALLGPERNGVGGTVVRRLLDELNYPNLLKDKSMGSGPGDLKHGWNTTQATKYQIVMGMVSAIRDGSIHVTHASTIDELLAYRQSPNGGWEGDPNDDEVMALGIAWQLVPLAIPSQWEQTRPQDDDPFMVNNVLADMDRRNRSGRSRRSRNMV